METNIVNVYVGNWMYFKTELQSFGIEMSTDFFKMKKRKKFTSLLRRPYTLICSVFAVRVCRFST